MTVNSMKLHSQSASLNTNSKHTASQVSHKQTQTADEIFNGNIFQEIHALKIHHEWPSLNNERRKKICVQEL